MKKIITLIVLALSVCSVPAQTSKEVYNELCRLNVPHPEIVLAQARLETGNFTSILCKKYHNLFGIKHKGRYAHYRNWRESVADYKRCISSRYKGGDYYVFLRKIGYASDTKYTTKVKNIAKKL